MASTFYGQNNGVADNNPQAVTISDSASQSKDIELRIDQTKGWTKQSARLAVMNILNAMMDADTGHYPYL